MAAKLNRRSVLAGGAAAAAAGLVSRPAQAAQPLAAPAQMQRPHRILLSLKYGMVGGDVPMADKFKLVKSLGYDGIELESPAGYSAEEVRKATADSGLPVHGLVDSVHWQKRLSSPDEATRRAGIDALAGALRDARDFGGHSVLLVPGRVADAEKENQEQVWERSIAAIHEVLPMAAELGVHILIENVWNGFCYQHDGPPDQSADQLAAYIDAIGSPWVGAYFDIGNHQKYGKPAEWIRTLGRRVVKLDVKDWGVEAGWAKIGDGDVDWADVRKALDEVGFTGWATAEVGGGDSKRLADIHARMERALRA
ncbi:MAG: sugar phosphate isomerase/epimerase family protein [Planctomycetota bacterium]